MKIRNLLILPLCLALAPCSAQEQIRDVVETVVSTAPAFSKARTSLKTVVDAVRGIHNREDAEAFVRYQLPQVAAGMSDLLDYVVRSETIRTHSPELVERLAEIKEGVDAVANADVYGSETMARLQWGWKQLDRILQHGGDVRAFADSFHQYKHGAEAPAQVRGYLSRLHAGESAEKIGRELEWVLRGMRGADGSHRPDYAPAPRDFQDWARVLCGSFDVAEKQVRKLLESFRDEDYYGSAKLKSAVATLDKKQVQVEEQARRCAEHAKDVTAIVEELLEILRAVTNKADADAAAPRIIELRCALNAKNEEFDAWEASIYVNLERARYMGAEEEEMAQKLDELDGVCRKLLRRECLGSDALFNALPEDVMDDIDYDEFDDEYF